MDTIKINIAADFTSTPGDRLESSGPYSGETFFNKILKKKFQEALDKNVLLEINLDGAEGYSTGFLQQAFCGNKIQPGLAMYYGKEVVLDTLELRCEDNQNLKEEIMGYIRESEK